MSKTKVIQIDSEALRRELTRKGYKLSEASRAIGKSDCYITNRLACGTLPQTVAMLLEHALGIPVARYVVTEEEEEKPEEKVDIVGAVKEALKEVEVRQTCEVEIKRDQLIDALVEALLDPDVLDALEKEFYRALRGMGVREVVL